MICPKCNKKFYSWRLIYLSSKYSIKCPKCKTQLKEASSKRTKLQKIRDFLINVLVPAPVFIIGFTLEEVEFRLLKIFLFYIFIRIIVFIISQFTTKLEVKIEIIDEEPIVLNEEIAVVKVELKLLNEE